MSLLVSTFAFFSGSYMIFLFFATVHPVHFVVRFYGRFQRPIYIFTYGWNGFICY